MEENIAKIENGARRKIPATKTPTEKTKAAEKADIQNCSVGRGNCPSGRNTRSEKQIGKEQALENDSNWIALETRMNRLQELHKYAMKGERETLFSKEEQDRDNNNGKRCLNCIDQGPGKGREGLRKGRG